MSCGYQGYEFGAGSYPDSICVDGRLFDGDHCDDEGRLYDQGEDIPCPICRPHEAIDWWTDRYHLSGGCRVSARRSARLLVNDIRVRRGAPKAPIRKPLRASSARQE